MVEKAKYYRRQVNGIRFCAPTPELLEKKIRQYFNRINGAADEQRKYMTISEYIIEWHEEIEGSIQHSTYNFYKYAAWQIITRIGFKPIISVTPALLENCVKDFANTKLKDGKNYPSQKYIDSVITVLKLVFKKAKKELLLPANYAEDISVKSKSTKEGTKHRSLTQEEINRVLNFNHPMRPYCLFLMLCGLMPEEAVPLKWKDISYLKDSDTYIVSVNKTAELSVSGPTKVRPGKTKNEFRKREIPIPFPLDSWIKSELPKHKKNELIFKNREGCIFTKSALRHRWSAYVSDMDVFYFKKKNKNDPTRTKKDRELTIRNFKQYDLRHTYATVLASIDTPVRKTTALMGHAEAATTDKYYIDASQLDTIGDVKRLSEKIKDIKNMKFE